MTFQLELSVMDEYWQNMCLRRMITSSFLFGAFYLPLSQRHIRYRKGEKLSEKYKYKKGPFRRGWKREWKREEKKPPTYYDDKNNYLTVFTLDVDTSFFYFIVVI